MKTSVACYSYALILCTLGSLNAQNLSRPKSIPQPTPDSGILETPADKKFPRADTPPGESNTTRAQDEDFQTGKTVLASQNSTLHPGISKQKSVESLVDLRVLREPSPYRNIAVNTSIKPTDLPAEEIENELAHLSAIYRQSGKTENTTDCPIVALSIEQHIQLDPAMILEIVDTEIRANPACSCEITKSAIIASEASVPLVVDIVETAIASSPEHMRIISQCAIATLPEATAAIQVLLSKLDPGKKIARSSKSSKDSKDAANEESDESSEEYLDPNQDPDNMVSAGPPNPPNQISEFPALLPTTPPPTAISPPSITTVDPTSGTPKVINGPRIPRLSR